MPDWKDEVAGLDIADVAQKLGLQIAPGRRWPRLAVCPFHDDTEPSLHLYQGDNPHYHCFACHAHGDAVELVKQRRQVDFGKALDWLASQYRLDLGRRGSRQPAAGQDIRQRALGFLRERDDGRLLAAFAASRGFKVKVLTDAGITAGDVGGFLQSLVADSTAQQAAIEAGLAHVPAGGLPKDLRSQSLAPFVLGDSILIPLFNLRSRASGFMARPLSGRGPKYRFTTGLRVGPGSLCCLTEPS